MGAVDVMALCMKHARRQWERSLGIMIILCALFLYWNVSSAAEPTLEKEKVDDAYATKKNDCKQRRDLPEEVRLLLPEKGLVFLSGGFVSVARRLRLDLSTGLIDYGSSRKGGSSVGTLKTEGTRKLTSKEMKQVVTLANVIWASEKKFTRIPPIADFDVRLVLCDGEEVRDIQSYGPPVDEVAQLYTLLWNLATCYAGDKWDPFIGSWEYRQANPAAESGYDSEGERLEIRRIGQSIRAVYFGVEREGEHWVVFKKAPW